MEFYMNSRFIVLFLDLFLVIDVLSLNRAHPRKTTDFQTLDWHALISSSLKVRPLHSFFSHIVSGIRYQVSGMALMENALPNSSITP